jgi:hypothetical protein
MACKAITKLHFLFHYAECIPCSQNSLMATDIAFFLECLSNKANNHSLCVANNQDFLTWKNIW